MKPWVKLLPVFLLFSLIFLPQKIEARSGCCSSHGGVCGCGCCDGTGLSSTCAPYYPECGGGYGNYNSYQAPPSCPLMSTYNSLTDQCECMSGYIASGNSCISQNQACTNKYGFMAQYDYLSSGCKCLSGYIWNSSGTACVSGSQSCSNSFGFNAEYDSLSGKCKCRYGYVWNTAGTNCISEDESCQVQYGYNSKATLAGDQCECKYGYLFNKSKTKCITQNAACQELNGFMSEYDILSNGCKCLTGYRFNGNDCVLDETNYVPNQEVYPNSTYITPVPTKKPIPTLKPTLIPTLTPILSPTEVLSPPPTQPTISDSQTAIETKTIKIQNIFSRFFSWLFGQ